MSKVKEFYRQPFNDYLSISQSCGSASYYPRLQSYQQGTVVTLGDNIPNWKQLLATGQDATTTLHVDEDLITGKPGSYLLEYNCKRDKWNQAEGYFSDIDPPLLDDDQTGHAINRAKEAFLNDLMQTQKAFEGLTFLAELRESVNMLRRPASTLAREVKKHRRVVQKRLRGVKLSTHIGAKRATKIVTDSWLESVFGWQPLISDIEQGAAAVTQATSRDLIDRKYIRSSGTAKVSESTPLKYSNQFISVKGMETHATTVVCIFRGVYSAKLVNTPRKFDYYGVNWTELPVTAYEIIPYSWLADYFINIGDMLQAACWLRKGLSWSNQTVVRKGLRDRRFNEPDLENILRLYESSYGPFNLTFSQSIAQWQKKTIERARYTENFIPDLEFSIPGFKQGLNIIAVGTNLLNSRHK
jgi:hypothetical protein